MMRAPRFRLSPFYFLIPVAKCCGDFADFPVGKEMITPSSSLKRACRWAAGSEQRARLGTAKLTLCFLVVRDCVMAVVECACGVIQKAVLQTVTGQTFGRIAMLKSATALPNGAQSRVSRIAIARTVGNQ